MDFVWSKLVATEPPSYKILERINDATALIGTDLKLEAAALRKPMGRTPRWFCRRKLRYQN